MFFLVYMTLLSSAVSFGLLCVMGTPPVVLLPVLDRDKALLTISRYTERWNLRDYILPNIDRVSLD